jgi:hypothetical protein
MSATFTRLRLGAGVAALALSLAACGGKSNGAQPATGGPVATEATTTTVAHTTTTAGGSLFDDDSPTPGAGLFGASGSNASASVGNSGSSSGSNGPSGSGGNSGSSTSNNSSNTNSSNSSSSGSSSSGSSSSGSSSSGSVDPARVRAFFATDAVDVDLGLALVGACSNGDMQACDTLYMDSEDGSKAEAYGQSCGERGDGRDSSCVEVLDSPSTGDYVPTGQAFGGATPTDSKVKALVNACRVGSMNSCDALLFAAPKGSPAFAYGQQCGARSRSDDLCVEQFGLGSDVLGDFLDAAGISHS